MRTLSILVGLFTAIVLSSCEGNTTREWKVINNSSEAFQVDMKSNFSSEKVVTIETGKSETIYVNDTRGGQDDAGNTSDYFESSEIVNLSNTERKDIQASSNWKSESEHAKRVPSHFEHKFTISISDDDFY
ncbi:MAG: hypothetical protein CL842_09445 [Crocinitomicaceae bacterium]|nr:hypothetical protein [Crocinitomicaceae bacterium]|tara:strand:+ start:214319 stop:214711 length:393 start_codon:yes stop_codon:yes gene_type:complete